jgi:hypothetical protein
MTQSSFDFLRARQYGSRTPKIRQKFGPHEQLLGAEMEIVARHRHIGRQADREDNHDSEYIICMLFTCYATDRVEFGCLLG